MDFIAAFFELAGTYLIGVKNKWGFLITCFALLVWILVAIHTRVYGLLLVVVPSLFLNAWNFWKWNKAPPK